MTYEHVDLIASIELWTLRPDIFVRELFGAIPDVWQDEVLQAFPHEPRIAMKAPLSFDNVIVTPNGERLWKDINIGDYVFADDGTPTKVVNRFDVGEVETYRVTFRDGSFVDACADHIWKIQTAYDRRIGSYRELTTKKMLDKGLNIASGQRKYNIPIQGAVHFSEQELPLNPYVLGLWIGDGSRAEPSIICPDKAIQKEIETIGFQTSLKKNGKTIRVLNSVKSFFNTEINDLYCYEKYIPEKYKYSSIAQRLDLLRGMMDSDGTTAKNGHTYLATSSVRLVDDFMWLARSLGFMANKLGPYKINNGNNRDSYRVVISGALNPFRADTNKKRRWRQPNQFRYTRFVDKIVPIGLKNCMCIEVEHQSSCFLANDFIVTHNCKGPGKTTVLAWIAWNFLLTRPDCKVIATSNTASNLKSTLWAELYKWYAKSELLQSLFEMNSEEIYRRTAKATWWLRGRALTKSADENSQFAPLAGLHADYVMILSDEMGDCPADAFIRISEGIFGGSPKDAHIVIAGNPTHVTGALGHACLKSTPKYWSISITAHPDDPKRTPRISKEYAQQMIDAMGIDNDTIKINILGEFPSQAYNSVFAINDIEASMQRGYTDAAMAHYPTIFGVDAARGGDDKTAVAIRKGLAVAPFVVNNNLFTDGNVINLAGKIGDLCINHKPSACFFDAAEFGISDVLRQTNAGFSPIRISFSGTSTSRMDCYNKRAEMYLLMNDWIKEGGALPDDRELKEELIALTYSYKGDKKILMPKDELKVALHRSPDKSDAVALTFAMPVNMVASSFAQSNGYAQLISSQKGKYF